MTTTPGTHPPAAGQAGPPTSEQLVAELVAWLIDLPAVRRALIAKALADNRWKSTLDGVCRQALDQLLAAAIQQEVPHPYEYVANQLGVADAGRNGQPITGDSAELMQRLVRKLSPDSGAGAEPAVQDVGEADESTPPSGAPH